MTESNAPGSVPGPVPDRDPRLAGFAEDGAYGHALPSAALAGILEDLADGTGRPPPEATDDEIIGMLSSWQALEAHASARMLAVLRDLIRRRPKDGRPAPYPGDLPAGWDKSAVYEAAAELGVSWQSAAPLLALAWDLQARLPGTGRLLDQGIISAHKARIVSEELSVLDDDKAAETEKLLLDHDLAAPSMTPGRLRRLCQRLADTADPDGARERRETAQRERARVSFFRSHGGDTSLFADGLPADEALAAQQNIQTRALAYRDAGICPDDTMDLLRVLALVDLINQASLDDRIARYRAANGDDPGPPPTEQTPPDGGPAGRDEPADGGTRPSGSPDGTADSSGTGGGRGGTTGPRLPSLLNLTLPLATLLGLADRPGEIPGYGSVDPGLVRDLAKAAASSPRTTTCLTITDDHGHATGHACARLIRATPNPGSDADRAGPAPGTWDLQPDPARPGPDGGYGAWILTLPGGSRWRLGIHPVPLTECDHRHATASYRPGALLRHLVEIRDGECVSVSCSHPARSCDYEHATPWDKNGITDACNAGPVSRSCHQVKQKPGWGLSNPEPAIHRWSTPSGRTYDKGPKTYPA
ncbi:MAG: 13E12 repeat family protein [Streptosporangiales bacterium]|nr:13E12 repeat family protein [Streptosporangiales bacterium]